MLEFEHDTLAQRVLFGAGKAASNLAAEVGRLGATSVMVIAGPAKPSWQHRCAARSSLA